MAVRYKKDTASLHADNRRALDVRVDVGARKRSYWVDSALTRYYTMVDTALPQVLAKFDARTLRRLQEAVLSNPTSLRNQSYLQLRAMFRLLAEQHRITRAEYKRVRQLPPDQFLSLLDQIERMWEDDNAS